TSRPDYLCAPPQPARRSTPSSPQARRKPRLALEPVTNLEDPRHHCKTDGEEQADHEKAHRRGHIGDLIEAPAESADEINHRIEQRNHLPDRRQDRYRIKGAAEERKRRDDEKRHELKLLEAVSPNADNEAEQAEGHRGKQQKAGHPEGVRDSERHEQ